MRGHIRKRGSTWTIVLYMGMVEGKPKYKWVGGFKTRKEAEAAMAEYVAQLEKGMYADSQNLTLEEYLTKWLKDYAEIKVAQTTFATYIDAVNHIKEYLGHIKLEKLRPADIQAFISHLSRETNLSIRSVRYFYAILNIALNTAVKWQLIAHNPCDAVTPPQKTKQNMQILTSEQVNELLTGAKDTPLYVPILLAVTCGLRRGEILGLYWDSVDLQNNIITVTRSIVKTPDGKILEKNPKSNAGVRAVTIPDITVKALRALRKKQLENKLHLGQEYKDNNLVCCWDDGTPFYPDYLSQGFKKLLKKLNLPDNVRFHDLRHTHATLLLQQGVHPKVVQERLGHSSVSITLDTYSHVLPTLQKEAANKIDDLLNS
ncbi:tyrosine-type recombinase/integrase [Thermoanaerobacterium sp. DL9XJH110]|uniref:site-specific integrase n=1 Tax=Thermoanaerobacterium sp. DL9XJH110 TaxID=3386643 RepID=UPI003BB6D02A